MITSDKEARARERERDAQVGLPARRAAAELLSAVLQKKQALDDILGRSLDKGRDVQPDGARPRADPRHRGDEPQAERPARPRARRVSRAWAARAIRHALSDPAVGRGAARLSQDAAACGDRPCRHARPIRSQGEALRQAGQCRAAQGGERGRGHRGEPRCGAGQHAGLAVVALGRLLGRDARTCDRRRASRRAAARSHREERA